MYFVELPLTSGKKIGIFFSQGSISLTSDSITSYVKVFENGNVWDVPLPYTEVITIFKRAML